MDYLDPLLLVKVWPLSGDQENFDDPVWGMEPIWAGSMAEVAAWLHSRPDTGTFTVTSGMQCWTAPELLVALDAQLASPEP